MKYLSPLLLLVSITAFAGDYYEARIDTYDAATGLYYKGVTENPGDGGFLSSKTSRSAVVNVNIFDPTNGTSTLLFKEPQKNGISIFVFETGFKDGRIDFSASTYPSLTLNNTLSAKREPRDKLLVGVRSADSKETTLFVSNKKGAGLTKLVTVPSGADWHIDVKNSKLRVVHQTGKGVRIESYEW